MQAVELGKVEEICSHSQAGGCVPQWSPSPYNPYGEGQQCRRFGFGIISGSLCIAPSRASSDFHLCPQKCEHLPPPLLNPYISETAFSHRFQKGSKTLGKMPKPTKLAHSGCPREIYMGSKPVAVQWHTGQQDSFSGQATGAALDTNAPQHTPQNGQYVEDDQATFGSNLVPKAPENFSAWWGVKFRFLLHVCTLKMLRISWGIQVCMQNMKKFSDP